MGREGLVKEACIVQGLVIRNHEVRREGLLHGIRLAEHKSRLTLTTLFSFARFQGVKVVLALHLAREKFVGNSNDIGRHRGGIPMFRGNASWINKP